MSKIVVQSEQGYRTAINIRQHTVVADELIQDGGTDTGPTPMEILLGTAGACVSVTTIAFAKRHDWPLESVTVELEMEEFKGSDYSGYTGDARRVHEIREHITFTGDLTDEQRQRLSAVARKCPVHQTLENPVFFVRAEDKAQIAEALSS